MPQAQAVGLVTASDAGGKPVIDWSDRRAKDELITALVNDANAVLSVTERLKLTNEQQDAVGLLALVAGQDVEPGESQGTWHIARRVAKDRVIPTADVAARHGHKSTAVRKDGFRAHLVIELDTGIITAA